MTRCAETVSMRRGAVSLRCDRHAGHQDDLDVRHYDLTVDAFWTVAGDVTAVWYSTEGA